jgi:hypothetical protein
MSQQNTDTSQLGTDTSQQKANTSQLIGCLFYPSCLPTKAG